MAKKPLELTPTPLGNDEVESRYERGERRIELTTKSGNIHKQFSHETGTVQIDTAGVAEQHEQEDKNRHERAEKLRSEINRENEKLQELFKSRRGDDLAGDERAELLAYLGKWLLSSLVVYFCVRAIYEGGCWLLGKPATEAWAFVILALFAGAILSSQYLPARVWRIGARLTYALLLIYFGLNGALNYLGVFRRSPTNIAQWGGVAFNFIACMAVTICAFAFLRWLWRQRQAVYAAKENVDHPLRTKYPALLYGDNMRLSIYALEAALFTSVLMVASIFNLGLNVVFWLYVLTQRPVLVLLYLGSFLAYFFFRRIFYPAD